MQRNKETIKDTKSIGERVKNRREELGLSLNQVAIAAGISKSALHDLETKPNVRPSAEVLYNISQSLNTTIAFLLGKQPHPMTDEASIEIPPGLEEFARKERLTEDEKRRLACIKYRDEQPKTSDDWAFVHEAIKRVIASNKNEKDIS